MGIAHRDTYKALQTLKFCMHIRWDCAAISQKRAAFSQASKAMLVFTEIMSILYKCALCGWGCRDRSFRPQMHKYQAALTREYQLLDCEIFSKKTPRPKHCRAKRGVQRIQDLETGENTECD